MLRCIIKVKAMALGVIANKLKLFFLVSAFLAVTFSARAQEADQDVRVVKAVRVYPKVHVEVLKVKTDSRGRVVDSILGVSGADKEKKEIVLVTIDGELTHVWAASTAQNYKQRYHKEKKRLIYPTTSEGIGYKPQSLVRYKSSTAYGDGKSINMPYAIFFNGGIALHGTTPDHFNELGKKDSGGCVRLYPPNAAILWSYLNPDGYKYISDAPGTQEIFEDIQSRVTIDVYGFDRTSAEQRRVLYEKYEDLIPQIQEELRANLAQIKSRK